MTIKDPKKWNSSLAYVLLGLCIVITARLVVAAGDSGNWKGFYYSLAHLLIVAGASYWVLRSRTNS